MSDNNRLELDIVAVDDTAPAVGKAKANFNSLNQDAAQAAQRMSKSFDEAAVDMARSIGTWKSFVSANMASAIKDTGSFGDAMKRMSQQWRDLKVTAQAQGIEFGKASDNAASAAMQRLEKLEARAARAGKSGVEKLLLEKAQTIGGLGADEKAIQRAVAAFDTLITARQKYEEHRKRMDAEGGHSGGNGQVLRRSVLGIKDFLGGSTRGAIIEGTDILVGTSAGGGILTGAVEGLTEFTGLSAGAIYAIGGVAAAFVGLGVAGTKAMSDLAEKGREIENTALRTGIPFQRVQAFQFAARASGVDPSILERLTRSVSQIADDTSPAGKQGRAELERLGVHLRDQFGDLKPTQEIILEIADAINSLPPGLKATAASIEVVKRAGIDVIPFFKGLRENVNISDAIGGTFTEADAARFKEYEKAVNTFGETWRRFKLSIEAPLAGGASDVIRWLQLVDKYGKEIPQGSIRALFQSDPGAPGPLPKSFTDENGVEHKYIPTADDAKRTIERSDTDARIKRLQAADGIKDQVEEARKALRALPEPQIGVSSGSEVDKYEAARNRLRQLEASEHGKGSDLVGQALRERDQLKVQMAELELAAKAREIHIDTSGKELVSNDDMAATLALVREKSNLELKKSLDAGKRSRDANGNEIDISGTAKYKEFALIESQVNNQRIEVESKKELDRLDSINQEYWKKRTDEDFKWFNEAGKRKEEAARSLASEMERQETALRDRYYSSQEAELGRERDLSIANLGMVDAQSLKEKRNLEDAKFAIESEYAERTLALEIQKLTAARNRELGDIRKKEIAAGPEYKAQADEARTDTNLLYDQRIQDAQDAAMGKQAIQARNTVDAKVKYEIEENRKVYDSLKHSAEGVFDALISKSKSFGDVMKDLFKTSVLTPIKDILSSQTAAMFTRLLTGKDVTFSEVGNGQGALGKLGSVLGRAGLGTPQFGDAHHSNLNLPGHLGDVSLVQGAVPVVITNSAQVGQAHAAAAASGGLALGLGAGIGALGGLLSSAASAAPAYSPSAVTSTIDYGGGNTESFGTLANIVGGPGGTSGFAGPVGASSSGGGILGSLGKMLSGGSSGSGGGILSGLKGILGQDVSGTDLGNGVGIANSGLFGHLAAFGKSPLAGTIGAGLTLDGITRAPGVASGIETPLGGALLGYKYLGAGGAMIGAGLGLGVDGIKRGGIAGTAEAAGGGALVGLKLGGVEGAVIGAAIGAGAAILRTLFDDDRSHTKKLVKQVYGMSINNATADEIIKIAKSSYGGQIDVAVRSQQVRDLLKLYAEATGNKSAKDQFVQDTVHSASLTESGGKLFQNAVYDNGQAYSYSSPLSTYGGVQTSPLPTYARDSGAINVSSLSLSVNGDAATNFFDGRVATVATPGFIQGQAINGSTASIGRNTQTNLTLGPSAISR